MTFGSSVVMERNGDQEPLAKEVCTSYTSARMSAGQVSEMEFVAVHLHRMDQLAACVPSEDRARDTPAAMHAPMISPHRVPTFVRCLVMRAKIRSRVAGAALSSPWSSGVDGGAEEGASMTTVV